VAAARHWTRQAALAVPDAALAEELRLAQLREPGAGAEIGQAWCDEARRLAQQGEHAGEAAAWRRAAEALPPAHPWRAAAAWRAARQLLAQDGGLSDALGLLSGPAWAGDGEDAQRCRFMLAQVLEKLGRRAEARHAAESLRAYAQGDQRERLQQLLGRLSAAPATP
jgi:hypothetical protein